MTLGGLAAAVGLVIDDAIVVVENIVMHRDSGQSRAEAIRSAIREIRVPLIGSTITPIVVFLPLISITGVTGVFFRALAVTVGMALLTSLALALTWTPTLSHYFLRSRGEGEPARQHDTVPSWLMNAYERTLRFALEHPLVLGLFTVLLIGGSYLCFKNLGSDLLPAMDEGGFIVDYVMPAGSSLRETNRVISHVEQILRANAGGGEHLAPHGFATRLGDRYGSEYGRRQREIETDGAVLYEAFRLHVRGPISDEIGRRGDRRRSSKD